MLDSQLRRIGAVGDELIEHIEHLGVRQVPDGVDGEATRDLFDDVDDYDGLTDNGARNQFDAAIAELANYTVSVSVTGSNALPSITSTDLFLISVTVTHPENINFTVSGYRANF